MNIKKIHLISLREFNLPLIASFTRLTPPGPYRATTCRGRELISGSHTYFIDHRRKLRASPNEGSAQLNAGATSETAQTWKTIHTRPTLIHSNKANMKRWLWRSDDIRGPRGPKVSWHLSCRWGKTPKNHTQETCPEGGSNPGSLRDRRARYRLFHSSGQYKFHNSTKVLFISTIISG